MKNQANKINLDNNQIAILTDGAIIMNADTFLNMLDGGQGQGTEHLMDLDNDTDDESMDQFGSKSDSDDTAVENDIYCIYPEDWDVEEDDENADEYDDEFNETDDGTDNINEAEDYEDDEFFINQAVINTVLHDILKNPKTDIQNEIKKEMTDPNSHIGNLMRTILL